MRKMKPSFDKETIFLPTHLWQILWKLTNQRVPHFYVTSGINQSTSAIFESQYQFVNYLWPYCY